MIPIEKADNSVREDIGKRAKRVRTATSSLISLRVPNIQLGRDLAQEASEKFVDAILLRGAKINADISWSRTVATRTLSSDTRREAKVVYLTHNTLMAFSRRGYKPNQEFPLDLDWDDFKAMITEAAEKVLTSRQLEIFRTIFEASSLKDLRRRLSEPEGGSMNARINGIGRKIRRRLQIDHGWFASD